MKTIFVDMDGVVADFVTRIEQISGKSIEELNSYSYDVVGEMIVEQLANGLFEHLPPMPDMRGVYELMRELEQNYEVVFLTACSDNQFDEVLRQKIVWLNKHGFGGYNRFDVIGVNSSKDKARYASKDTMLIDDRSKACDPFFAAGGKAIKHTSAADTREQLIRMGALRK